MASETVAAATRTAVVEWVNMVGSGVCSSGQTRKITSQGEASRTFVHEHCCGCICMDASSNCVELIRQIYACFGLLCRPPCTRNEHQTT